MGSQKTDPVLLIVGLILILAVIAWIGATSLFPPDTIQKSSKSHQYSSTGKAFGEFPGCTGKGPDSPGCKRAFSEECRKKCEKNGFSCQKSRSPGCINS